LWLIEMLPQLPTGAPNPAYAEAHAIMTAAGSEGEQVNSATILFS
jgi:hypothetical protein